MSISSSIRMCISSSQRIRISRSSSRSRSVGSRGRRSSRRTNNIVSGIRHTISIISSILVGLRPTRTSRVDIRRIRQRSGMIRIISKRTMWGRTICGLTRSSRISSRRRICSRGLRMMYSP